MKIPFSFLFTVLIFTSILLQARTFTDAKGRKIEATLKAHSGDNIVITTNGKDFSLPISNFSTSDQEFIRKWIKENPDLEDTDYKLLFYPKLRRESGFTRQQGSASDDGVKIKKNTYSAMIHNKSGKPIDNLTIKYEIYVADFVVMKNKAYSRMAYTHKKTEQLEVIAGEKENQSMAVDGRIDISRDFFTEFYLDKDGKRTGETAEDRVIGMHIRVFKGDKEIASGIHAHNENRMSKIDWKNQKPGPQVR